jgi:hypothetical protein
VHNHRQALRFVYIRYPNVSQANGLDFAWGEQTILANATLQLDPALKVAPSQLRLSLLPQHVTE